MAKDKAKILVCEDNVALSGVICFNLVRAGFEVTSVGNGRLALDALEKGSFDLVLSDQQMPMMTGIQLCENFRQLPAHRRTPFILLTAKCMEIDFVQAASRSWGFRRRCRSRSARVNWLIALRRRSRCGCQS